MRGLMALGCAAMLAMPVREGVAQARDSGRARDVPAIVTWLDLATLGAGVAGSLALMNVDARVARRLQEPRYQDDDRLRDVSSITGKINEKSLFAAGLLTYGIARLVDAPRTTTDIAFHTTEAVFIASAASTVVRGVLGRSRPFVTADSDAYDYRPGKGFTELRYRSYPSIHAASAFATAAALTAETARHSRRAAWVVAPIAFPVAALPGLSRMYQDKHWASDVVMGTALGAVAGWATVRYHHHRPGNRVDEIFLGALPSPASDGGLAFSWRFAF